MTFVKRRIKSLINSSLGKVGFTLENVVGKEKVVALLKQLYPVETPKGLVRLDQMAMEDI